VTPDLLPLDHLIYLTDCFGIIQHASHALPEYRTGYTTDDNARALAVAVGHYHLHRDQLSRELAARYLALIMFAQRDDGSFGATTDIASSALRPGRGGIGKSQCIQTGIRGSRSQALILTTREMKEAPMPLSAKVTTDHNVILRWAQDRGGRPAAVTPRTGHNHTPSVYIDFPGHPAHAAIAKAWSASGASIAPLTWDEFFERFEQDGLAFLYQERTSTGMPSRLFRIVSR